MTNIILGSNKKLMQRVLATVFLLAIIYLLKSLTFDLVYIGDEPRYLYMAISYYKQLDFTLPYSEWHNWITQFHLSPYKPEDFRDIIHSPVHSIFMSPFVGLWGPDAARWFHFFIGAVGYILLIIFLIRIVSFKYAVAIAFILYSSFPIFPYLTLCYSEVWLLTFFTAAWLLIVSESQSPLMLIVKLILALMLPFLHIRFSLISTLLIFQLAYKVWLERTLDDKFVCNLSIIISSSLIAFIGFILFQVNWTGSIAGSASTIFKPRFFEYFERLAIQLFTIRHGLFVYNPLLLLALIGLLIGLRKNDTLPKQAALFLLLYSVSFVWGTASASFPARFWVGIMPVFAVGLAVWLNEARSITALCVTLLLLIGTLTNVVLFFLNHNLPLANAQVSATYDLLYQRVPIFFFPPMLPWDRLFFIEQNLDGFFAVSNKLLLRISISGLIFSLLLILHLKAKTKLVRYMASVLVWTFIIIVLREAYALQISPNFYRTNVRISSSVSELLINFQEQITPKAIRFDNSPMTWMPEEGFPEEFNVSVSSDGNGFSELGRVRAAHIVDLPINSKILALKLQSISTMDSRKRGWATRDISILQSGGNPFAERACFFDCIQKPSHYGIDFPDDSNIVLGKPFFFGKNGDGSLYLLSGWANEEAWGVWTLGEHASLYLPYDSDANQDLILKLDIDIFLTNRHKKLNIRVLVNNELIDNLEFRFNEPSNRTVLIPKYAINKNNQALLVTFEIDGPKSPKELGINDDSRKIGLGLKYLMVSRAGGAGSHMTGCRDN